MVKLVCYNIEYCMGMQGHVYEYLKFWRVLFPPKSIDQKIVESLKDVKPDIIALVEVDKGSIRAKKNSVRFFKNMLDMDYFVNKVKYPIEGLFSLMRHMPILRDQGNAMISRYKLSDVKHHYLKHGIKSVVIEASVRCPKKLTLLLCHFCFGKENRKKQIGEVIDIVNSIKNPVIVMGDFNTFSGKREIRKLLEETKLKDKAKLRSFTYPSYKPRMRLDYVLVSPDIKVNKYKVLKYNFSDHMPLFVDFTIR